MRARTVAPTPLPYEQIFPLPRPSPILRCFWKNSLMSAHLSPPQFKHLSRLTPPHPPKLPPPPPHKNFDRTLIGNVSSNSKPDHPLATPSDSHFLTLRWVGFSPNLLCPGIGVLNSRNFLQFWKKSAGISWYVSKKLEAAWKACCAVSYQFLQKY